MFVCIFFNIHIDWRRICIGIIYDENVIVFPLPPLASALCKGKMRDERY
jgi:hypothetical protein